MKKLIIAGGTGFLGKSLIEYFSPKFDNITVLTRGKSRLIKNIKYLNWDAENIDDWQQEIEGSDVLINMTGRSVDCRYNQKNKKIILNSRVNSTKVLDQAIQNSIEPPKVWLNSSTATIYRHSLDIEMSENGGEIGSGFSVEVAKAWENAFFSSVKTGTRKIALRTSIVFGKGGGAFTPIKNLAKLGFGGKQGLGNQKVSWIHIDDFVRSIEFILQTEDINGVINLAAPKPTNNFKLMKTVRNSLGVPFGIPLPKGLLEIGARLIQTETELILKSRNVIPTKLLKAGFKFKYNTIFSAIEEICN